MAMDFNVSYHKYQMFSDEENLIYEDDDDEGWDDEIPNRNDLSIQENVSTEEQHNQIAISDTFDQGNFVDKTLSSYSAPENRVWNLGTRLG